MCKVDTTTYHIVDCLQHWFAVDCVNIPNFLILHIQRMATTQLMAKNKRRKRKRRLVFVKTIGGKWPDFKVCPRDGHKPDEDEQQKFVRYIMIYKPEEENYTPLMTVIRKKTDDFDCNICWKDVDQGYIILTPCNHQFCEPCLKQWFTTQLGQHLECTCPMCREPQLETAKVLGVLVDIGEHVVD